MFDRARSRSEHGEVTVRAGTTSAEAVSFAKGMRKLELAVPDESATRALANAKKRFEDARREATKAFANEALELSDRIHAMQYRVMATILEVVDNPSDALAACRVCTEELHSLSAVWKSFNIELKKGLRARFSKDERREIISSVCHVIRVIYDVMLMVCFGNKQLSDWPTVDTGDDKVDPLREGRVEGVPGIKL